MDKTKLLVLANSSQPELVLLDGLPVLAAVGNEFAAIEQPAAEAEVILCWPGPCRLLEQVWPMARSVRWVHCVYAGLDGFLFPALIESNVPVTNSRGVFSDSLGEFVIAAVLFFAKDLRRMIRSQACGGLGSFRRRGDQRTDRGHPRLRKHRESGCSACQGHGHEGDGVAAEPRSLRRPTRSWTRFFLRAGSWSWWPVVITWW